MLDDMEPGTKQGINPHPFTLRALKPELLMVLRHVGMDLLAYDGAPCGEAVGPLTEAARRIEADPGLCRSLQPADSKADISSGIAEGLRWAAERCADRLPGITLRIRIGPRLPSN